MRVAALVQAALALGVAGGVHLAAFAALPLAGGRPAGAGDDGGDVITLASASGNLTDLVATWDRPPLLAEALPEAPAQAPTETQGADASALPRLPTAGNAPVLSPPALPILTDPLAGTALPSGIITPQLPPPEPTVAEPATAPAHSPKPKARPEQAGKATAPEDKPQRKAAKPPPEARGTAAQRQKTTAPPAAARAAGSGTGAVAGTDGTAPSTTLGTAQINSLKAGWGGAIRARIEAKKRYPQAAGGAVGNVTLRLTVARGGTLQRVAVIASSGNGALDQAAVTAVQRAGRFPPAPKGLAEARYSFSLLISFLR